MAPTVPGGPGSPPGTPALSVGIIFVVEEGAVPCLATPPAAASFAVAFSAALAVSRLAARSASLARMASRALAASFRPSSIWTNVAWALALRSASPAAAAARVSSSRAASAEHCAS